MENNNNENSLTNNPNLANIELPEIKTIHSNNDSDSLTINNDSHFLTNNPNLVNIELPEINTIPPKKR